jgi:hypothetical protein
MLTGALAQGFDVADERGRGLMVLTGGVLHGLAPDLI